MVVCFIKLRKSIACWNVFGETLTYLIADFVTTSSIIAPDCSVKPEVFKAIFCWRKRATNGPETSGRFVAFKKRFKNEDLERKAGIRPKKLEIKNFIISIQKTEQSLIFAVWEERLQIRLFLKM